MTLARPDSRNAFDAALIAELREAFSDVGDARAVVLAGDGKSFCAGADVEWMRSSADLSYEENVQDARRLRLMLETIDELPRAGDRPRARPRARRRRGPRRVRGHRGRGRGNRVRVLGGEARDRPVGHLAVRAREDRAERGTALLRHGRELRRGDRPAHRAGARGRGGPRPGRRAARGRAAHGRARGGPPREAARARPARRARDRAAHRRARERARRAKKASARSWTSASRAGSACAGSCCSSARSSSSTRCSSRR